MLPEMNMTLIDEEILRDMDLAREVILHEDVSTVVTNNGKIWRQKKGEGIRPILEIIEEMGEDIHGSVIGDKFLGRASALLCRYAKASGVYSPQGTKTGIALLIMGQVPCQIDKMIPNVETLNREDLIFSEKILTDVVDPEEAYKILKENILE